MNLSLEQKQTLKAWITANMPPGPGVGENEIAAALNVKASPDFFVFRRVVSTARARAALVWSEVLAASTKLPETERWSFDTIMNNGTFDPGVQNNRVALNTIFGGSGFAATRAAVLAASTRTALVGEKVLSAPGASPGGGDGSAANQSAVMGFWLNDEDERVYAEGPVSVQNVIDALNS